MCAPWDTGCLINEAATAASNTVLGQISQMIISAEQYLIDVSASWWVLVPSIKLYPGAGADPQASPIDAVANIRGLILPITAIVAMGGMLWNGLLMVLSRKPAPLVNVLRGLWNTALWSAVGVFGTNLLLHGTDQFSAYVITSALRSVGNPSLGKRLATLLIPVSPLSAGGPPMGLVMLIGTIAMICAFIQALLMLFRDGSVLILAASTPLAASGSFTNATGGWLRKVMTWQLALIFYKPVAAMVYAAAIWLQGENTSADPRVLFMGVAMMLVSLVALPVLLRFFNWTIGSLQGGGNGLGILAAAGAAAMHAAGSLRGAGGFDPGEHARYLADMFDRGSSGGPGRGGPGPSTPGPGPVPSPGPTPGPTTGQPPGPAGNLKPPAFRGDAGPGKVSNITSAGSGTPAAGATASGASGAAATGSATGAATGSATGAATGAAMGASAAAGPAAPVVAAAVVATRTVIDTAKAAATAAANAAADSTKGQ